MNYFIDSKLGNDSSDGSTRQTAFKTLEKINSIKLQGGDCVYFKAGCEFHGNFIPNRAKDDVPVVVDRYGIGEKPKIIGGGGNGIDICDIDQIEINNISIDNPEGRCGIYIHNESGGVLKHIHIKNCEVRNVYGHKSSYARESGGIICGAFSDKPSWFDDLLLEDNLVSDVNRTGIFLTSFWTCRPFQYWGRNQYVDDSNGWWPSYNVVFRGNMVIRPDGDGIVLIGAVKPLMEWNTVYDIMVNPTPHCANAGLWPQATNGCVMQYNEVGYSRKPEGCDDAQGYDVDLACKDTLIQYNYSHDNGGGFLLLCEDPEIYKDERFTGTIVRNNLSINDGHIKGELVAMVGPVKGVTIENNTIISSGIVDRLIEVWSGDGLRQAKNVTVRNNIFISNGKDNRFNLVNGENFEFDSNLFWGDHKNISDIQKNAIAKDPLFVDGTKTGDGLDVASGYIPMEGSPALDNGLKTSSASAIDYLGKAVGTRNYIGALINK